MAQQTLSPDQLRKHQSHLSNSHSIGPQSPKIPKGSDTERPEGIDQLPTGVPEGGDTGIPTIEQMGKHHHGSVPTIPGAWPGDSSTPRGERHNDTGIEIPDTGEKSGSSESSSEHGEPEPPEIPEHEHESHSSPSGGQRGAGMVTTSNTNNTGSNTTGGKTNNNGGNTNTNNNNNSNTTTNNTTTTTNNNGSNDKNGGGSGSSSSSNSNNGGGKTPDDDTGKGGKGGDDDSMVTPDYNPGTPAHKGQHLSTPGNGQPAGDPDDTQTSGKGSPNPSVMLHNPNQVRPNGEAGTGGAHGSRVTPIPGNYDPADGTVHPGTGTATPPNIPEHPGTEGH